MEFIGKQHIPTSRENVWLALNNLDVLKACVPGCHAINWVTDSEIDLLVRIKLGLLKFDIGGTILLSNIVPDRSYTMVGRGKAKFAGLANGRADVKLTDNPSLTGTDLSYVVTAEIAGKLATLGGKIVKGSAQKLSDGFFENFKDEVIKKYGRTS